MHHATGWDTLCLIAVLTFSGYITKLIIHRLDPTCGALAARVTELEAERSKILSALQALADTAGAQSSQYAAILDTYWPGWREIVADPTEGSR